MIFHFLTSPSFTQLQHGKRKLVALKAPNQMYGFCVPGQDGVLSSVPLSGGGGCSVFVDEAQGALGVGAVVLQDVVDLGAVDGAAGLVTVGPLVLLPVSSELFTVVHVATLVLTASEPATRELEA